MKCLVEGGKTASLEEESKGNYICFALSIENYKLVYLIYFLIINPFDFISVCQLLDCIVGAVHLNKTLELSYNIELVRVALRV